MKHSFWFDKGKKLILLFIGVIIIGSLLYIRVIYHRLPKELYFVNLTENKLIIWHYDIIILICIAIIIAIPILIICYKQINKISLNINPNNIIIKIIQVLNNIIEEALFIVYEFLINLIPDAYNKLGYNKLAKLALNFCSFCEYKYILGIDYVIRVIIIACLTIDVLVYFKLNLFYKSLLLLVIFLGVKFWLYCLRDWSNNKEIFKEKLDITHENVGTPHEKHKIKFLPAYQHQNLNLMYYIQQYRNCLTVSQYLANLQEFRDYYNPRFNLMYYSIYLLNFSYVIISNIIYIYYIILPFSNYTPWI